VKDLTSATREELIEIAHRLLARVEQLEEEVRRLRRGGGGGVQLAVKPSRAPMQKKERKRRKQAYVRRREETDEVRYHGVECCPDCGRNLWGGWEHRCRQAIQIELPPVRVSANILSANLSCPETLSGRPDGSPACPIRT